MAVKARRSERLLVLKGNLWWYRQGVPEPVRKLIQGPRFLLINLETSDVVDAKRQRDLIEALTSVQFAEVKDGRRLALDLPRGVRKAAVKVARGPVERGTIVREAISLADDDEQIELINYASEVEADLLRPLQRKRYLDAKQGKVEIDSQLESYLESAELAPKTTNERRGLVKQFAQWCNDKGRTLDAVDRRLAGQYVSDVLDGKHPKTQGKYLSSLRQYWIYLARRGHITLPAGQAINSGWPWNDQKMEKRGRRVERGETRAEERPFTDLEVKTLLTSNFPLNPAWEELMQDVLRLGLLSGMRQAEILSLWSEDITDEGDVLVFDIKAGKTDAAARKVPVHSELLELVQRRRAGKASTDLLFHELSGASNPADTFGKRFKRWRVEIGVDDRQEGVRRSLVNFHSARRWFTTKARHAGQARETIGNVIGHRPDKNDVTFGVYAKDASLLQRRDCVEAVKLDLATT